jgi:hypothetical protein
MFIASMATLMQSYLLIKLFFLGLFLLAFTVDVYVRRTRIVVYRRLVWFYACIGMAGVVWALVGVLHPNNYVQANLEALRLYVVWSAAFVVLYTLLRTTPSLEIIHKAIIIAGILISVINIVGVYDELMGGGLISDEVRQELGMQLGFVYGFKITSPNIGALFVIAPYLLSLQFRSDVGKSNSLLMKPALFFSLLTVALSGRRALWIVVALTPCTVLLLSVLGDSYSLMKAGAKRFVVACALAGVLGLGTLLILPENRLDIGTVNRLEEAFSSDDLRAIQKPYLIRGFMKSPVLGSGFGANAGYTRSDERPWMYELTYYQMFFNLGTVGVTFLVALFLVYLGAVVWLLRQFKDGSAIPFALLVAVCSLLVGAYSNPYSGSFDFLFFVGLLPYLSTFQHGFHQRKLATGAAV